MDNYLQLSNGFVLNQANFSILFVRSGILAGSPYQHDIAGKRSILRG